MFVIAIVIAIYILLAKIPSALQFTDTQQKGAQSRRLVFTAAHENKIHAADSLHYTMANVYIRTSKKNCTIQKLGFA